MGAVKRYSSKLENLKITQVIDNNYELYKRVPAPQAHKSPHKTTQLAIDCGWNPHIAAQRRKANSNPYRPIQALTSLHMLSPRGSIVL
jgi:hypothetical protein